MMELRLKLAQEPFHMVVTNEDGLNIDLDASESIGGQNKGFRPMQLLLAGLAGCSSIDVLNILRKGRQEVKDFQAIVTGERQPDAVPSLFQTIHVHFVVQGPIAPEKVQRAVSLSLEKYCSVAKTLEKTAVITSSFEVKD